MMISNQSTDGVITDKVNCFYDKVKMIEWATLYKNLAPQGYKNIFHA